jgi:hypothetical protein
VPTAIDRAGGIVSVGACSTTICEQQWVGPSETRKSSSYPRRFAARMSHAIIELKAMPHSGGTDG